jgi:glycosyltransferase involved in cell wall biosynthesis
VRLFDLKSLGVLRFERRGSDRSEVAVVIPLYNYAMFIGECLGSVLSQDLQPLSIVVIDDYSSDGGGDIAIELLDQNAGRFRSIRVVRHLHNQGLAMSRNSGIVWSDEPYLFMLDADNRIRRPALSRLLDAVKNARADFAYSQMQLCGDEEGVGIADIWEPQRLALGNYIDAMALVRRDALLAAGGYAEMAEDPGWEDYDLWCRFAGLGFQGVFLPELLCEYRLHGSSMLRSRTNLKLNRLYAEMALRHPGAVQPVRPAERHVAAGSNKARQRGSQRSHWRG